MSNPAARYLAGMSDENPSGPDDGGQGEGKIQISATADGVGSTKAVPRVYDSYAERWWADAAGEASAVADADDPAEVRSAVRRQIVFVVCALESWFFEWVRDDVLDDVAAASALFVEGGRERLTDRIKRVLCELHARGELATKPGFAESDVWEDLHEILDDRHGLVHAVASLPRGDVPEDAKEARPTPDRLVALAPAEPLVTVRGIVELVTSFADAEPPDWMEVPDADG